MPTASLKNPRFCEAFALSVFLEFCTFAAGAAAVRPEKKFNARPAGGVERLAGGLKAYICNELSLWANEVMA